MNVWAKMITALRGGINEAGEAITDSQALRILDQELRDASEEVKNSKEGLASIIAHKKIGEEKFSSIKKQISEYEDYASQALDKNDENLALEIAQKIADLENNLATEDQAIKGFHAQAEQLRLSIKQAETNIKRMQQQVDTVKATESVQRAQEAVAERHSGSNSKLRTAMDSLERIKEKQAMKAAKMKAASELADEFEDKDLQVKLEEAGIAPKGTDASSVLERIKNKK